MCGEEGRAEAGGGRIGYADRTIFDVPSLAQKVNLILALSRTQTVTAFIEATYQNQYAETLPKDVIIILYCEFQ